MDRWARIVDRLLGEVIGDGDISDLPGAGEKLPPLADSHTSPDQRAAFKIMQDNEVAPEWMALAKSLEQSERQIRAEFESEAKRHDRPDGAARSPKSRQLEERIDQHNRDVIAFNLKAPRGIPHKSMLNSQTLYEQALAKAGRNA
ncbi:MAG: DUF1992 domain-containing protein [Chloroflexi bacterium]|nr:DUF1992 domain-containing protein [Chloroflexota bacterium]